MARPSVTEAEKLKLISEGCGPKTVSVIMSCDPFGSVCNKTSLNWSDWF